MPLPVRLGLFYGAIFIGTGVSSPYLPVWFAHHGLYGGRIGLILSLPMLARVASAPLLAVCSSRRRESCPSADAFVAKDVQLGARARVLREDLSHGEINMTLGAPSDYTAQVDAFLDSVR